MNNPTMYNDSQIDIFARGVYMKALKKLDETLDASFNPDRLQAYAAVASAACEGIIPETGDDGETI